MPIAVSRISSSKPSMMPIKQLHTWTKDSWTVRSCQSTSSVLTRLHHPDLQHGEHMTTEIEMLDDRPLLSTLTTDAALQEAGGAEVLDPHTETTEIRDRPLLVEETREVAQEVEVDHRQEEGWVVRDDPAQHTVERQDNVLDVG